MPPVRRAIRAARYVPQLLQRTLAKAWHDRVLGLSAEAAFWQMLSLPSLFLALIATLGYVSRWFGKNTANRAETEIENGLSRAFSPQVEQLIHPTLHAVLSGDRAGFISIGFVLALWAGSSATATFVNTVSIAYAQRDLRGPVRSRLLALWLFLGTVAIGVFVLPMLVLGPDLLRRAFPRSVRPTVSTLVDAGYWPFLVVVLLLGLTTFYKVAPPRRMPWHRGLPGAVFAVLVFLAGSSGLRAYIRYVVDHNRAYATLGAPIAALLFFFVLALGVLLGAEFNAAIELLRPSRVKPPRVLDPRSWQVFQPGRMRPVDGPIAETPTDRLPHPDDARPDAPTTPPTPPQQPARPHRDERGAKRRNGVAPPDVARTPAVAPRTSTDTGLWSKVRRFGARDASDSRLP